MNQQERSAESGDDGGGGVDPADKARGRDRLGPRWLVWLALAAAIVVAAICATDDPEPLGLPAGGDSSDCYTTEADQPQQPRDTNRYVIALTADDAGAQEEYARCQHLAGAESGVGRCRLLQHRRRQRMGPDGSNTSTPWRCSRVALPRGR